MIKALHKNFQIFVKLFYQLAADANKQENGEFTLEELQKKTDSFATDSDGTSMVSLFIIIYHLYFIFILIFVYNI